MLIAAISISVFILVEGSIIIKLWFSTSYAYFIAISRGYVILVNIFWFPVLLGTFWLACRICRITIVSRIKSE
jgi:hypothetical protein